MHTCEVKIKGWQKSKIEKIQNVFEESEAHKLPKDQQVSLNDDTSPNLSVGEHEKQDEHEGSLDSTKDERMDDIATSMAEEKTVTCEDLNGASGDTCEKSCPGAFWDVFRRQDVPKLIEYLKTHWKEFGKPDDLIDDSVG